MNITNANCDLSLQFIYESILTILQREYHNNKYETDTYSTPIYALVALVARVTRVLQTVASCEMAWLMVHVQVIYRRPGGIRFFNGCIKYETKHYLF